MFKVSVIIPSYNSEKVIINAIDSLMNQSIGFENIELIIVDDNSQDGSKEILKNFEKEYYNIKCVYCEDNSGSPSRGRNIGIDLATSDYVMFLDQDDTYEKEICEKLYNSVVKNNVNVGMCKNYTIENGVIVQYSKWNHFQLSDCCLNPKENKFIFLDPFVWNKIFKISFLRDINLIFPEGMFEEDLYFSFHSFLNSDEIAFVDYYGYNHFADDSSTTNGMSFNSLYKFLQGFKEIWKTGGDKNPYFRWMFDEHFIFLLYSFVTSNTTNDEKIEFLEDIYDFENEMGWIPLKESWAEIMNRNIKKRNFKRVIYMGNALNFIRNSKFIRNIYRKIYKN